MSKWGVTLIFMVASLAIGIVPLGFSQTAATGALTGNVMDSTSARIPGVEMKLTSEATGESRIVISNENGVYIYPLLAPGSYRLEATLSGFKTAVRSNVRIPVTETTRLDVQLEVGN